VEAYALTEASPSTHATPYKGERRVGSIGLPLPGTNARIVNVEEVLYEHPKVLEVAVVSTLLKAEKENGHAASTPASPFLKAFVVLKRGQRATAEELFAYARERLDAYKLPHQIEFRSELPKNAVGKVIRSLLMQE
jgi:long-chain acyl-CoA synthetase